MHKLRPIPRRENETKSFDDDLIARTLSNAADIRRALSFSRGNLFLDAEGRRSDPENAAQASTDGCIRLASMALCPDDSLDARDLRWHAATRFQRHIGCGIETYDNTNTTAEKVAADLDKTAAEVRNPAARYTAEALEKAGHPEAAERLYYILKEIADDPDEVPVSQESLAHLASFIATTTLPRGAIISIDPTATPPSNGISLDHPNMGPKLESSPSSYTRTRPSRSPAFQPRSQNRTGLGYRADSANPSRQCKPPSLSCK